MVSTDLRGKTHAQPGCTTCAETERRLHLRTRHRDLRRVVAAEPDVLRLRGGRGVSAVAADRDRDRGHLRPGRLRRAGQLLQRRRHAVPQDRGRTRPRPRPAHGRGLPPRAAEPSTRDAEPSIVSAVAPKVLFIYNDPIAPEALLGEVFTERGFDVDIFTVVPADRADDPARGRDVPRSRPTTTWSSRWGHAGRCTTTRCETPGWAPRWQMVRDAIAAGVGVLGVCFGGQLVAQALGGTVGRARPQPELGWYHIDSDAAISSPTGPWFEWHSDRWTHAAGRHRDRPERAARRRRSSLGTALALQFHPELDDALLELWLADDQRRRPGPARCRRRPIARRAPPPSDRRRRTGCAPWSPVILDRCWPAVGPFSRDRAGGPARPRRGGAGTGGRVQQPAGKTRWLASASSRTPSAPSSSRGPNDGTGSSAGRCSDVRQRGGVFAVAHRLGADRVDRPGQPGVVHRPVVDVDQVVDADPGQPLPATAEPTAQSGGEQRPQQSQGPTAGGLHDAGAHPHHPQARLGGRRGSRPPSPRRRRPGNPSPRPLSSDEQLVAAVESVEADRRRGDEHARAVRSARAATSASRAGRLDPAVADRGLVRGGEPSGDRCTGQMHDGVDPVEQIGGRPLRIPLSFVRVPRGMADQADHPMPAGAQERAQRGADQARRRR